MGMNGMNYKLVKMELDLCIIKEWDVVVNMGLEWNE